LSKTTALQSLTLHKIYISKWLRCYCYRQTEFRIKWSLDDLFTDHEKDASSETSRSKHFDKQIKAEADARKADQKHVEVCS
jgi:hypothetical protein